MLIRLRPRHESMVLIVFALIVGGFFGLASVDAGEVLRFRLPKPKSVHVKDETTAKSYDKSLKNLGVSSKIHSHDGHYDLSMQCPQWREAEFKTHAEVEKWDKWLVSLGFETKHQH
jgi:hypothetical protein